MKGKESWEEICDKLQHRVQDATPPLEVKKAKLLRSQILKCLTQAHNEGVLNTKIHELHNLLKLIGPDQQGVYEIVGGQRNFKRVKSIPHFERFDLCWFDFAILVDENSQPAEVIGFNFEIRFPEDYPLKFIRFDLNLPDHRNQDRGMRFYIHPGTDDFLIHSPPMSPLEILHLFLYGLEIPAKPRQ